MKKIICFIFLVMFTVYSSFAAEKKPVVVVWYPNESGADFKDVRSVFDDLISKALGRPVVDKLTTDYAIAIESVANNNAAMGMAWGAQGYIECHAKNPKVLPLVVPSGVSGTLSDAVYYSWLCVKAGNEKQYSEKDSYSIDKIQGKKNIMGLKQFDQRIQGTYISGN